MVPATEGQRGGTTAEELRAEIVRLGPWHLDVEVTPEVSTAAFLGAPAGTYAENLGHVSFISPREYFRGLMRDLYPEGLDGRSVLDCACNCGGYLFWSKEIGAGRCFGFDVRAHWIDQAEFLRSHRVQPSEDVTFAVNDLYDLPGLGLEPFDLTIFKGILYHLPDPVTGLKIAADLTREAIIVNTATLAGPPNTLVAAEESDEKLMSGVHRLSWFPTGPEVVRRMLAWCGFPHSRLTIHGREKGSGRGRIELVAARGEEVFEHFDKVRSEAADPDGPKSGLRRPRVPGRLSAAGLVRRAARHLPVRPPSP